jgi:multidrug resistance efflux pump
VRRRTATAAGFLLLIVAVGWLARRATAVNGRPWAVVERGDLALSVEVWGVLRAEESAFLGPPQVERQWEFKVSWVAPEGSEVEAGAPVLRFDATELERQLEQRRNEGRQAATELDKRQVDLARSRQDLSLQLAEAEARQRRLRLQTAVPPELVAAAESDQLSLDLRLAEREVAYLKAKLAFEERRGRAELAALAEARGRAEGRVVELEAAIARMTVSAPRRGTVVYAAGRGDEEEKVKVGDSVWMGRVVLEIPDLGRMVAAGEVDEADAGRLVAGQQVRLALDAHPGIEYRGRVAEVGTSVRPRAPGSPVKVAAVEVVLDASDPQRMRPGMRFSGRIETEVHRGVLLLPADAVVRTAEGPRVVRRRGFSVEEVAPKLGRWGPQAVEVVSGLEPGDRVLRRGGAPGR